MVSARTRPDDAGRRARSNSTATGLQLHSETSSTHRLRHWRREAHDEWADLIAVAVRACRRDHSSCGLEVSRRQSLDDRSERAASRRRPTADRHHRRQARRQIYHRHSSRRSTCRACVCALAGQHAAAWRTELSFASEPAAGRHQKGRRNHREAITRTKEKSQTDINKTKQLQHVIIPLCGPA